jgi:hypothetical protein
VTIIEHWYQTKAPELTAVLAAMSLAGIVMAFQWAMLCTRMWHYHLEYGDRVRELWLAFREDQEGTGANA